jgi:hypothetical protein
VAKFAATDYTITINGSAVTDHVAQVELSLKYNDLDTTSFGQVGVSRTAGLLDGDVKLDIHQDYANGTASLDAFLYTLTTATTVATVVVTPTSGAVGTSNPSYTMTVRPLEYTPFSSSVGDLATISVTWPLSQSGTVLPVQRKTA